MPKRKGKNTRMRQANAQVRASLEANMARACTTDPYDTEAGDDDASSGVESSVEAAVTPPAVTTSHGITMTIIHMHLLHIDRLRARINRAWAKDAAAFRANSNHVIPARRKKATARWERRITRLQAKVDRISPL